MVNETMLTAPASVELPGREAAVVARLGRDGFVFVDGCTMRAMLGTGAAEWEGFTRGWDDLGPDRFMADGGSYRKRRFARLRVSRDAMGLKPPRPHFQALDHNPLNGGVQRVFSPVEDRMALHPANRATLETCRRVFEAAMPVAHRPAAWHVEMHQFRIEAAPDVIGRPTPEGLHRDGVDWVLVLMIRRENVEGGISTIADADRAALCEATLSEPLDACLLDDRRVFHGVSGVVPLDPTRPAWRDVLVLTFRAERDASEGDA